MSKERGCQSPERTGAGGRESEHGAGLGYAPRRAAQAGLTGGAERSSRLRRETAVVTKEQPKAERKTREFGVLHAFFGSGATGRFRPLCLTAIAA